MYIEQLYTNCLAEAAYYIESNGEAAIIDPIREINPYLKLAEKRNAVIKYVFETHFHADFVSGHIDLAKKTGATIVFGPEAEASYKIYNAQDNEEFQLGKVKIKVLHTPGHTLESCCYLILNDDNSPYAIFTGDTLFVGDVGRPDLAVKSDLSKSDLAGMLFESLNSKIKTLPDDVIVYPAHGAGSACGKNIGKETYSTIGEQKKYNYALQATDKSQFIKLLIDGIPEPPKYFFLDAEINKNGYENIEEVMKKNYKELTVEEVEKEIRQLSIVLDTRPANVFEKGYIPGSINVGLDGQFAIWVGSLLDIQTPLVLVSEPGKEEESIVRLARVGYENVKGFLKGGFEIWKKSGKKIESITSENADEFVRNYEEGQLVLDVRNPNEWEKGIVKGATLIPLAKLEKEINQLEKDKAYHVHCAGGYRSMIAASILKRHGMQNIVNIRGGMSKMKEAGLPLHSLS